MLYCYIQMLLNDEILVLALGCFSLVLLYCLLAICGKGLIYALSRFPSSLRMLYLFPSAKTINN